MRRVRSGFLIVVAVLLAAGYAGSLAFALTGRATEWADKMDKPPIVALAALIVIVAIALGLRREEE